LSRQRFLETFASKWGIYPGISRILEHTAKNSNGYRHNFGDKFFNGATSGIAWRRSSRHLPEIQDGSRQNEICRFCSYMAKEIQFLIPSERI